jgi:cysteine desulfurase
LTVADDETIYLDHAATTPCRPEVVAAMLPYFGEVYGNPSGIYRQSRRARRALDEARGQVAAVLRCDAREVVFTSGGSESDNLALKGTAWAARRQGRGEHVVVSAVEHHAVLHAADELAAQGFPVTYVPVDAHGQVSPAAVAAALRPDTGLVSVMLANNEVGTINPIAAIAALTRPRGIVLHTDAVQAAGALPLDVAALGCDLLSLSGHKFYGPKGVGVLYIRDGTPLLPQQQGGSQENRRRAGTENTPGIVGLATALTLAEAERGAASVRLAGLRDQLQAGLRERVPGVQVNGHPTERLPGTLHISVPGVEGEAMLLLLDAQHVAASTGSACTSGSMEASHVLTAMGLPPALARASLRLTLGRSTTEAEIERVLAVLPGVVEQLRVLSPVGD